MSEQGINFNSYIMSTKTPAPLHGETLDSEEAQVARDEFFLRVRQSLQPHISYLAMTQGTYIHHEIYPGQEGHLKPDIMQELRLRRAERPSPIAFALQTFEDGENIVRFGPMPANKYGRIVLRNILQPANDAYDGIMRRSS